MRRFFDNLFARAIPPNLPASLVSILLTRPVDVEFATNARDKDGGHYSGDNYDQRARVAGTVSNIGGELGYEALLKLGTKVFGAIKSVPFLELFALYELFKLFICKRNYFLHT
jgi:hypothetical protein